MECLVSPLSEEMVLVFFIRRLNGLCSGYGCIVEEMPVLTLLTIEPQLTLLTDVKYVKLRFEGI
jgi:hypothetical protein